MTSSLKYERDNKTGLLYKITWNGEIGAYEIMLVPGQKLEQKGQDDESVS